MKHLLLIAALTFSLSSLADPPTLHDANTGEYLGNLSSNPYDYNSTSNPYGPYGSPYSPTSIKNEYGPYGSPYSPSSVNNPYATSAPVVRGH